MNHLVFLVAFAAANLSDGLACIKEIEDLRVPPTDKVQRRAQAPGVQI